MKRVLFCERFPENQEIIDKYSGKTVSFKRFPDSNNEQTIQGKVTIVDSDKWGYFVEIDDKYMVNIEEVTIVC